MWELDYKESWLPKNWCFWTAVLENTLKSPLHCKEIQPVHAKGDQSWVFIERTDAEAETPILWPPDAKNWIIGKDCDAGRDLGAGGEGVYRGWDGWMVSLTQWTWVVWIPGVGDGQGGLACCGSWGRKGLDMTEWLNWTEYITFRVLLFFFFSLHREAYGIFVPQLRIEPRSMAVRLQVLTTGLPEISKYLILYLEFAPLDLFLKTLNNEISTPLHPW